MFFPRDNRLQPGAKFAIMRAVFDEDKKLMAEKSDLNALSGRFRGFYPVVID
ncbi:MAG: ribonuclease T, partial [Serratia proteamaculans]